MICSQGCIIHFNHGMPHITGYMMSSIRYEGRIFNVNVESFERKRMIDAVVFVMWKSL